MLLNGKRILRNVICGRGNWWEGCWGVVVGSIRRPTGHNSLRGVRRRVSFRLHSSRQPGHEMRRRFHTRRGHSRRGFRCFNFR